MDKVAADKTAKQPHEEPAYGIEGVIAHQSLLKSETEAIFNAPPPKKEEPKNEPMSEEGKKEGDNAAETAEAEPPKAEPEAQKEDADMNKEQ